MYLNRDECRYIGGYLIRADFMSFSSISVYYYNIMKEDRNNIIQRIKDNTIRYFKRDYVYPLYEYWNLPRNESLKYNLILNDDLDVNYFVTIPRITFKNINDVYYFDNLYYRLEFNYLGEFTIRNKIGSILGTFTKLAAISNIEFFIQLGFTESFCTNMDRSNSVIKLKEWVMKQILITHKFVKNNEIILVNYNPFIFHIIDALSDIYVSNGYHIGKYMFDSILSMIKVLKDLYIQDIKQKNLKIYKSHIIHKI